MLTGISTLWYLLELTEQAEVLCDSLLERFFKDLCITVALNDRNNRFSTDHCKDLCFLNGYSPLHEYHLAIFSFPSRN